MRLFTGSDDYPQSSTPPPTEIEKLAYRVKCLESDNEDLLMRIRYLDKYIQYHP